MGVDDWVQSGIFSNRQLAFFAQSKSPRGAFVVGDAGLEPATFSV